MLTTVAAVVGVTSVAGCSGVGDRVWSQTGATDVFVSNARAEALTVTVTITAGANEEPHTARRLEIAAGETTDPVNQSKLPTNTDYTVEVAVDGGPQETFEWVDPTVERAPLWIRIDDSENIKFLLQAG